MKIAGISSSKAGDVNEGELKNRRQYQGAFSEYDEDIQWNDFALRNYDPQIARWVQQDPYQQFASPYVALGGDPVNMIDPSGGWSALANGLAKGLGMTRLGVAALTTLAGALIGNAAYGAAGGQGAKGLIVGAFLGLASNFSGSIGGAVVQAVVGTGKILANNAVAMPTVAPPQATISNVGVTVSGARYASNTESSGSSGGDDDWKPFYKSDLKKYVESKGKDPTESNLGDELENIYEEYIESNMNWMNRSMKFRRADKVWTEGTGRNSKPDFVSDDFYDERADCSFCPKKIKWVIEGSGYEVKQNNGKGIYLSSNTYQIKGHIDNLAAKHASDIASKVYNPSLTLITTYDVNWSPGISNYASRQGVQYTHRRAMYKIANGKYQFKFVGFGTSSW